MAYFNEQLKKAEKKKGLNSQKLSTGKRSDKFRPFSAGVFSA